MSKIHFVQSNNLIKTKIIKDVDKKLKICDQIKKKCGGWVDGLVIGWMGGILNIKSFLLL